MSFATTRNSILPPKLLRCNCARIIPRSRRRILVLYGTDQQDIDCFYQGSSSRPSRVLTLSFKSLSLQVSPPHQTKISTSRKLHNSTGRLEPGHHIGKRSEHFQSFAACYACKSNKEAYYHWTDSHLSSPISSEHGCQQDAANPFSVYL